jgi:hypothetical protein
MRVKTKVTKVPAATCRSIWCYIDSSFWVRQKLANGYQDICLAQFFSFHTELVDLILHFAKFWLAFGVDLSQKEIIIYIYLIWK